MLARQHCNWNQTPKWTRIEAKEHYGRISEHAEKLAGLLYDIRWSSSRMHLVSNFVDPSHFEGLAAAFDLDDDQELSNSDGAGAYIKFWIDDAFPDLPELLARIAIEAKQRAKKTRALGQPNSPRAKLRFFQEAMSSYFSRMYGSPLNKQVADITSAVFQCDVTEENVRKLVKYRQRSERAG